VKNGKMILLVEDEQKVQTTAKEEDHM